MENKRFVDRIKTEKIIPMTQNKSIITQTTYPSLILITLVYNPSLSLYRPVYYVTEKKNDRKRAGTKPANGNPIICKSCKRLEKK